MERGMHQAVRRTVMHEQTTHVAVKPSRSPGVIGMGLSVFLAGSGVALFTLSQITPASILLAVAVAIGAGSGLSLWASERSVTNPDQ
jgi:hypothetical protein